MNLYDMIDKYTINDNYIKHISNNKSFIASKDLEFSVAESELLVE